MRTTGSKSGSTIPKFGDTSTRSSGCFRVNEMKGLTHAFRHNTQPVVVSWGLGTICCVSICGGDLDRSARKSHTETARPTHSVEVSRIARDHRGLGLFEQNSQDLLRLRISLKERSSSSRRPVPWS